MSSDGQSGFATAKSGSYRRGSDNTSRYQNYKHVHYAHLNKAIRLYRNQSGCGVRFVDLEFYLDLYVRYSLKLIVCIRTDV